MLIFDSWYTAGRSSIYVAEDDGSDLRCLTSRYKLSRYQRLRISPHHSHLLFYAVPYGEEAGRFFCLELGSNRLATYEQEPYPYDIKWLTNDRLLCIRKSIHWIAHLKDAERIDLDFINGYLVMGIALDGNRLLLKDGPGIGGSIYVGDIEQRQVREVVRGVDYEKSHSILYPLSWSPNGQVIACVGGYEDEIWLVNEDGSNPRLAASGDYFWMEFQWSPDGSKIALTRGLEGGGPSAERAGVYVQDLQSGEENCILTLRRSERWRWATDGQSIVHSRENNSSFSLLHIEIDTRRETELIGPGAELKDIAELIVV